MSNNTVSVAAGDVNGDAIPDLALVTQSALISPRVLYLYLGNGDGTFSQAQQDFDDEPNWSVRLADVNHDALADMVVRTRNIFLPTDSIDVYRNTTTGNLAMDRPTATCGDSQATVSWTAPDGVPAATGYVVTPFVGYFALAPTAFSSTATPRPSLD